MKVLKSSEDYLEAIYFLDRKNGKVKSVDIAKNLGFTRASVSIAMKKLKENGYIEISDRGDIILTEKGLSIAMKVAKRHLLLTTILVKIGVSEKQARIDACKIEHDISQETFDALEKLNIK